jgi:hypothetical protein
LETATASLKSVSINPLTYRLEEIQKTVVAALVAILALIAYFIALEPGFNDAVITTVEAAFGVAAVFLSTNYTVADVDKSVKTLLTSGITLVSFFTTVSPDTGEVIVGVVAALVQVIAVYLVHNRGDRVGEGGSLKAVQAAGPGPVAASPGPTVAGTGPTAGP